MVVVVLVSDFLFPCRRCPESRDGTDNRYRIGTSDHALLEVEQYQTSFIVPPRPKEVAAIGRASISGQARIWGLRYLFIP